MTIASATEATLSLPMLPPPDNQRFIGRFKILSTASRQFTRDLGLYWMASKQQKVSGWVVVELDVVFPDRRKRDAGNLIKLTMDALVDCAAIDDDRFSLPRIMSVKRAPDDGVPTGLKIRIRKAKASEQPAVAHGTTRMA